MLLTLRLQTLMYGPLAAGPGSGQLLAASGTPVKSPDTIELAHGNTRVAAKATNDVGRLDTKLPRLLRDSHASPTHAMGIDQLPRINLLWAKRDRSSGAWHPLAYHLLDVAAVASRMWDSALGPAQKAWLQEVLQLEAEPARQMLALLAGLHDIGKAAPDFQQKAADRYGALRQAGLHERSFDTHHSILSAAILKSWFVRKGLRHRQASQLAAAIGGHHGKWIATGEAHYAHVGRERWRKLQAELCRLLERVIGATAIKVPSHTEDFNGFATFVAGIVSVSDWIGSNPRYFPFETPQINLPDYFVRSLEQATVALDEIGWPGWSPDGRQPAFESVLPFAPNPMQAAVMAQLRKLREKPRLVLIEYPPGRGKTEAALYAGDHLANRFGLSGMYIGMPTQAISDHMYRRLSGFLDARYPEDNIRPRLIHSRADNGRAPEDWFKNRVRQLLAPFSVGTIDQAMSSVIPAKHHYVRLFGLSHKVIIGDEIHSYDTYMNAIIDCSLAWFRSLESPMILLSATLSRQRRSEILNAVGALTDDIPYARYPCMTVVGHDRSVQAHELPLPETQSVRIAPLPDDLASLYHEIEPRYRQGGCIAIVCNTVDESIATARYLREAEGIEAGEVWLLHARSLPVWRKEDEDKVLEAFGKGGDRPRRVILVATQIIEQSLDLDFDLIASGMAPIDVLIQRVGRLHRQPGIARPSHLAQPTLLLRLPERKGAGMPSFGVDEAVYQAYLLQKTWLRLRDMNLLRIPDDIEELMEFVYDRSCRGDANDEISRTALRAALDKMDAEDAGSAFRAMQGVLSLPSDELLIGDGPQRPIATRDAPPGIDIICALDQQLARMIERRPNDGDISALLQHKVTVRHRAVSPALARLPAPKKWRGIRRLRNTRPLTFVDGCCKAPGTSYFLRLSREYGLEIIPEERS